MCAHTSRFLLCFSFRINVMPASKSAARNWCFTLNNYTEEEVKDVKELGELAMGNKQLVKYLIFGYEMGESGTPHLQGFISFPNQIQMKRVKEFFGTERIHLEVAKSPQDAIEYCMKEGKWEQYGLRPAFTKMKKATDAARDARETKSAAFLDAIRKGYDDDRLAEAFPAQYLQSVNKLPTIRSALSVKLPEFTQVVCKWFWGPSGIGKSRRARWEANRNPGGYYVKLANTKWFGGVKSTDETLIIEDVMPDHRELAYNLKIWADGYPFTAEYKGGEIKIRPRYVYVTSQYKISSCFCGDDETVKAIQRRFEEVNIETEWTPPEDVPTSPPPLSSMYEAETCLSPLRRDQAVSERKNEKSETEEDFETSEEERKQRAKKKRKREQRRRSKEALMFLDTECSESN